MEKPKPEANPIFEGVALSPKQTAADSLQSLGKNVNATAPNTHANAA
jgi:hypothetical protein